MTAQQHRIETSALVYLVMDADSAASQIAALP